MIGGKRGERKGKFDPTRGRRGWVAYRGRMGPKRGRMRKENGSYYSFRIPLLPSNHGPSSPLSSYCPSPFSPPLAPSFCIPPPNSALFSPRHGSHYSFRSPLCPSNHPPPSPRLHPCLSPSSSSPSPALPSPLNWGCVTSFIFCDIPLSACYTLSFPSARRMHP